MFLLVQKNTELFFNIQETVEEEKYRKSIIHDLNLPELQKKLELLMIEEKIYTDDKLSLKTLAEKVDVSPHQLSQFLNDHIKINFNSYLNRFRIESAKKILIVDSNRSALSIGFEVGFNNYTTFQIVFKKITGMSPNKYRIEMAKNK